MFSPGTTTTFFVREKRDIKAQIAQSQHWVFLEVLSYWA
jgi:hypothetical protein